MLLRFDGDGEKLLEALRKSGSSKRQGKSTPEAAIESAAPAITPGPRVAHMTYEVHVHTGDPRHGVPAFLDGLDRTAAQKMSDQIADAAEGKRGRVRRISQRGFTEGDISVYEIKSDHNRVYFRYIPGRRMVLLTAGHKDTQDTDVQRAFLMAAEYRGMKEGDPCPLPRFESPEAR